MHPKNNTNQAAYTPALEPNPAAPIAQPVGGAYVAAARWAAKKIRPYFPLYWLFSRNPYNGLL